MVEYSITGSEVAELISCKKQDVYNSASYGQMIKKEFEGETAAKFFNQKKILALLEEHKEGKVTHSIQIWVVYTFLMWYRAYFINNGDFEKIEADCAR